MTLHFELDPQAFKQGSTHFKFLHAFSLSHSELTTHSGLQFGGLPTYDCKHEHTAWEFISLH